jgi:arabinogalactan endo-1,4-beta-galactosidase
MKEYLEAVDRDSKTNVLKSILVTLKAEGFWFREKQEMHATGSQWAWRWKSKFLEDEWTETAYVWNKALRRCWTHWIPL